MSSRAVGIAAEDSPPLHLLARAPGGFSAAGGWSSFDFVSCDLERVAVGITEIDRMRNFVILKFKFDSALFQFALRGEKIFTVSAKSEMKHPKFAVT